MSLDTNEEKRLRMIIRDEFTNAIIQHANLCVFHAEEYPRRIRKLEVSYGKIIGYLFASSLLAGGAGVAASKVISTL